MSEKRWFFDRNPPKLEGEKKEKLLKYVKEEIDKIPKLKKAITNLRYYRNWVYLYHASDIEEGKNELLYRIAVFDDDYKNCALEFPHKSKVIIEKEGTLKECIKKVQWSWDL